MDSLAEQANDTANNKSNHETASTSSSSSILPISIDESNSKISDLNITDVDQQIQKPVEQTVHQTSDTKKDNAQHETLLTNNFKEFFEPLVKNLDINVASLRESQSELGSQIDLLANQMRIINENLQKQIDLDEYTKRLLSCKKRVNNVLATVLAIEERMGKIYNQIKKEQALQQQQQQQQSVSQAATVTNVESKSS